MRNSRFFFDNLENFYQLLHSTHASFKLRFLPWNISYCYQCVFIFIAPSVSIRHFINVYNEDEIGKIEELTGDKKETWSAQEAVNPKTNSVAVAKSDVINCVY